MGRDLSNILGGKKGINQERIWDLGNRRLNIKRTKGTTAKLPSDLRIQLSQMGAQDRRFWKGLTQEKGD